jgi:hypothetical protein
MVDLPVPPLYEWNATHFVIVSLNSTWCLI